MSKLVRNGVRLGQTFYRTGAWQVQGTVRLGWCSQVPALISSLGTRAASTSSAQTLTKPDMFCFQCEQTKSRRGCVTVGVCGKSAQVAALQDTLIYVCQGLAMYANRAIKMGLSVPEECDEFILSALFSTLTNVNFDKDRFPAYIQSAVEHRETVRALVEEACTKRNIPLDKALKEGPASWVPEGYGVEYLENEGRKVGVLEDQELFGPDVNGVRYMTIYGIKGLAAYAAHARQLGEMDPTVSRFIYEALDFLSSGDPEKQADLTVNLELALKVGKTNLRVMELLDKGHRKHFGVPSPASVMTKPVPGKCLLVSGHDLMDLYKILKATENSDVNVYTHGEMLPAHGYPELRKFKNLVGHFGGAWQQQKIDFGTFPGPVVVTTNCVIEPLKVYKDRLYTLNDTGINGVKHLNIHTADGLEQLVQHARSMAGFDEKLADKYQDQEFQVGFGREAILEHANEVLEAAQSGELKKIFVIGGCDGSEHKRNYFTNLAKSLPPQTLILTMGCAKYRINSFDFGTLGKTGIPRLLDMGQCNDSYGAVMVAKALASALNTDINSLPLSLSLSWFEQKAVAVLLSLLSLGVKNIRLGPVMPAFLTPSVCQALEEAYGIVPVDIRHPLEDMEEMFMK